MVDRVIYVAGGWLGRLERQAGTIANTFLVVFGLVMLVVVFVKDDPEPPPPPPPPPASTIRCYSGGALVYSFDEPEDVAMMTPDWVEVQEKVTEEYVRIYNATCVHR